MDHHFIADFDVAYVFPDGPDDPGTIGASGVKVFRLFEAFLPLGNDIDRIPERSPNVVVVDTGRHDVDEGFVIPDLRRWQHFTLPGVTRLTESALSHGKSMHLGWDEAERRPLAKIV